MFIIVKHIHASVAIDDLEQFVRPALKGGWWQKPAELKSIRIIGLVDLSDLLVERHVLMRITPHSEKNRVIKVLNNREIALQNYQVAEYILRHWRNNNQPNNARRAGNERRRLHLKLHNLHEKLNY